MNADKVVLVVCGADAAGYVAIVGQGFVQVVGNHRVLIGRAVLLGCQLTTEQDGATYQYAMVAYDLYKTLTDNGHVARGICTADDQNHLVGIHERTRIENHGGQAEYTEDDGATWTGLPQGTIVSMNLWGFTPSILIELKRRFLPFLENVYKTNPLKGEYFLPFVVDELLQEKKAEVTVLRSYDNWYGVTYKEDKENVMAALQKLKDEGRYPQKLWEE